jgi:methyl-accepting chemotaxis protein
MKNLRKHWLINPNFQWRFAILFSTAVLVFTSVFPIFTFTILDSLEKTTLFRENAAARLALAQTRSDFLLFLLLFILCAFFLAIFHSHRIAGPLYKLRISMVAMQQGVLDRHIQFRTKDNFQELAEGFNAMTDAIFIRRRKDFERVQSVIPKLERLQSALHGEEQALVTEVLHALQELSRDVPSA